jgi:hypothetical protein
VVDIDQGGIQRIQVFLQRSGQRRDFPELVFLY